MGNAANAIISKLEASTIWNGQKGPASNIILFSDTDVFPEPPYVVVKPEFGAVANTRQYRIIVHMQKGRFDDIDAFTLEELDGLLLGGINDPDDGSRFILHPYGFTDITPEPGDNTYFMEKIYFVPLRSS